MLLVLKKCYINLNLNFLCKYGCEKQITGNPSANTGIDLESVLIYALILVCIALIQLIERIICYKILL